MAAALALATAVSAWGQVATGEPPFATLSGGPDVVDLANLNVHIAIPIVDKAGVGMPFDYSLSYDTALWDPSSGAWQPAMNWGWTAETEATTGYLSRAVQAATCTYFNDGLKRFETESYTRFTNWAYHDPFGEYHFYGGLTVDDPGGHCPGLPGFSRESPDGSGYELFADEGGGMVRFRGGPLFSPPVDSAGGSATVTDPDGNTISTNGSSFTDTLGQAALTISGSQTPGGIMALTYSTASGGTAQVTVHYGSYAVATDFSGCSVTAYSTGAAPLVSEIDLPDGTAYHFGYGADGRLSSMTLPSGGVITYQYSGGSGGILCDGSAATLTRTTPDGTWVYQHAESGSAWTTTVTDPEGNQTEYQFQGIYQTEMQAYAGAIGGTPLKTVTTCYNGAAAPCNATAITLPIAQRTTVTALDDGLDSETTQTYDQFGLPLDGQVFGFGQGSPGGLYRQAIVSYDSLDGGAYEKPAEIQDEDGGGNLLSQTNFAYNTTGNLTSVTRWVSGSTYDTTQLTVNANGTVATQTDPMGHATSFTYGTGSCNGAFPTQTRLPSGLTTQATWNCYLGAPATAVNADGQTTMFQYNDPFGRLTEVDAPAGQVAVIAYDDAANSVDQYASTTADTAPGDSGWRHERDIYDWDGRPIEHDLVNDPGGLSKTLTAYDSLGEVASVSNPFRTVSDPTYGLTQFSYDALGRTITITNPDGSQASIAYGSGATGAGGLASPACGGALYPVVSTSAAGRKSGAWLDADGDIVEADEPNPSTGSLASGGFATCYTYTGVGQLATVNQGGQQRALSYDGQGHVLYALYPEAAANISGPGTGFGGTSWSEAMTYNADGLITSRQDANGVTTTYSYDSLGRLTGETFSDGDPALSFIYDSTVGCTIPAGASVLHTAGRMVCAIGGSGTQVLYGYDAAGRATDLWEQTPDVLAHQAYAYFYNGQIASYTNPAGETFAYSIDAPGRATGIQAPAGWNNGETVFGSAQFTPFEDLASASAGPVSISASFNDDLETTGLQASVAGSQRFGRSYSYDSDGLVTADTDGVNSAYNRSYAHDFLDRLTSVAAPNTPGADAAYTYDRWGNLYQATGSENWNVAVSATTNRVNGFSYNNDGELTEDASSILYSWDAAGQMTGYNPGSPSSYVYGPLGQRVQAVTPGGKFDYIYGLSGALRGVWNASASSWSRLEIGVAGRPLETWDAAPPAGYGNYTYSATSLLGSLSFRYNATAGTVNYHFLPSGLEWPGETGDATTNLRWGGHENDADSGLYHFLYRNYSPLEKRWLSPDPAGFAAADPADPQSWDRYAYTEDSPCSTTDPLGLKNCPPGFHPLTVAEGQAVVAAAQQIAQSGDYGYSENPPYRPPSPTQPGLVDCTHFVELAIQSAGLVVPAYQTTGEIANGPDYLPASAPSPGDVLLLDAGAGPLTHALLYAGVDGFYGSNSPTGRNERGGPQVVSSARAGNAFWKPAIAAGRYFIPCVKKISLAPPAAIGSGAGGLEKQGNDSAIGDSDEFDLLEQLAAEYGLSVTGSTTLVWASITYLH